METKKVHIDFGDRAYDIHIGEGLLARAGDFIPAALKPSGVFIITDTNVEAEKYADTVKNALQKAGHGKIEICVVPFGEASKSSQNLDQVHDFLGEHRAARDSLLIALGGGVIGDLAGYAASTWQRGIPFVQIPTTLLSQVDSSVGGKTGINTKHGKNMVGTFYQPAAVIIDIDTLKTLPQRELLAGYAEIAKAGMINPNRDAMKESGLATRGDFFDWLEANGGKVCELETGALVPAIETSVRFKAGVVKRDERETGERKLLNLGHTFGHGFEAKAGYSGDLLHGEGVAIGVCSAFNLSVKMGICPQADYDRVRAHFTAVGLRTRAAEVKSLQGKLPAEILEVMRGDKKVSGGKMTYIVVDGIGKAKTSREIPENLVLEVLQESLSIA